METKANYALVGFFTLLVIAAAFGAVYWMSNFGRQGDLAQLMVRIPGSANGLSVGSPVRFNGISVGSVRSLAIDQNDTSFVLARTEVRTDAPVTETTRAVLEIQGLTGSAYIELRGGASGGENILMRAAETGQAAQLTADPSSVTNILSTADQILTRVNDVVDELDGFVSDARGPLTETLQNTATFSRALTNNAEGIDDFLQSVAALSGTFTTLSGTLEGTFETIEQLLTAVDPAKIDSILANVDKVTGDVASASGEITTIATSFRQTATSFETFSDTAARSIERVDVLLEVVDAETVGRAIDDLAAATSGARQAINDTAQLTERFSARSEDVDILIDNVMAMAGNLNVASGRFDSILATVDEQDVGAAIAGLQTVVADVSTILSSVDGAAVGTAIDNFSAASVSARQVADDAAQLTGTFSEREGDVNQMITDFTQMATRLNAASVRVDGVLAKVDGFLGEGDASNLLTNAEAAINSFRQLADNVNARVGPITANLERFSNSGLRDVEALITETRRSISRIERSISSIESNPQRILFGGEDVKQFDGRTRR
jgi:phospholipid/cholesterol/gamma-HCH transport system substrate-binding protein